MDWRDPLLAECALWMKGVYLDGLCLLCLEGHSDHETFTAPALMGGQATCYIPLWSVAAVAKDPRLEHLEAPASKGGQSACYTSLVGCSSRCRRPSTGALNGPSVYG